MLHQNHNHAGSQSPDHHRTSNTRGHSSDRERGTRGSVDRHPDEEFEGLPLNFGGRHQGRETDELSKRGVSLNAGEVKAAISSTDAQGTRLRRQNNSGSFVHRHERVLGHNARGVDLKSTSSRLSYREFDDDHDDVDVRSKVRERYQADACVYNDVEDRYDRIDGREPNLDTNQAFQHKDHLSADAIGRHKDRDRCQERRGVHDHRSRDIVGTENRGGSGDRYFSQPNMYTNKGRVYVDSQSRRYDVYDKEYQVGRRKGYEAQDGKFERHTERVGERYGPGEYAVERNMYAQRGQTDAGKEFGTRTGARRAYNHALYDEDDDDYEYHIRRRERINLPPAWTRDGRADPEDIRNGRLRQNYKCKQRENYEWIRHVSGHPQESPRALPKHTLKGSDYNYHNRNSREAEEASRHNGVYFPPHTSSNYVNSRCGTGARQAETPIASLDSIPRNVHPTNNNTRGKEPFSRESGKELLSREKVASEKQPLSREKAAEPAYSRQQLFERSLKRLQVC